MSIPPLTTSSSPAPPLTPVAHAAADPAPATSAHAADPAPLDGLVPNPRLEFDPRLGIAVLEYQDKATQTVTYYPASARKDFSDSDLNVSA